MRVTSPTMVVSALLMMIGGCILAVTPGTILFRLFGVVAFLVGVWVIGKWARSRTNRNL
ncbi:hypothetical protein [Frondihabitans peucedani]|uniref:Uncharacterized protein n=1 Tax=Frondihabitans peucedani TaxID=598626 RepID=A0ABP8DYY6_9MICO